jgi:hypothetical protein
MAEYKVVKIGWENSNDGMNIVLVSRNDRRQLGSEIGGGVHVKKGDVKVIALVERQFRQFVGQENVATINQKLATTLGVAIGDTIEIDAGVTESEWVAFEQTIPYRRMFVTTEEIEAVIGNILQQPRDPQQLGGHE